MKTILTLICLCLFYNQITFAQENIEGRWIGSYESETFEFNFFQQGKNLCGHAYDFANQYKSSFCRTALKGQWNNTLKCYEIKHQYFINKSPEHVKLDYQIFPLKNKNLLKVRLITGPAFNSEILVRRMSNTAVDFPNSFRCFSKKDSVWVEPILDVYYNMTRRIPTKDSIRVEYQKTLMKQFQNFKDSMVWVKLRYGGDDKNIIVQVLVNDQVIADSVQLDDRATEYYFPIDKLKSECFNFRVKALTLGPNNYANLYITIYSSDNSYGQNFYADFTKDASMIIESTKGRWYK